MPLSNYDQYFGGKAGAAAEAHRAMVKEYGADQADRVFYALINKRKGKKAQVAEADDDVDITALLDAILEDAPEATIEDAIAALLEDDEEETLDDADAPDAVDDETEAPEEVEPANDDPDDNAPDDGDDDESDDDESDDDDVDGDELDDEDAPPDADEEADDGDEDDETETVAEANEEDALAEAGTSEGAKKGWETRRGHGGGADPNKPKKLAKGTWVNIGGKQVFVRDSRRRAAIQHALDTGRRFNINDMLAMHERKPFRLGNRRGGDQPFPANPYRETYRGTGPLPRGPFRIDPAVFGPRRRRRMSEAAAGECQWVTLGGRHICIKGGHGRHEEGHPPNSGPYQDRAASGLPLKTGDNLADKGMFGGRPRPQDPEMVAAANAAFDAQQAGEKRIELGLLTKNVMKAQDRLDAERAGNKIGDTIKYAILLKRLRTARRDLANAEARWADRERQLAAKKAVNKLAFGEAQDKPGEGSRFAALSAELASRGASDPDALAAYIGRKKYGAKKMAGFSRRGRKRAMREALLEYSPEQPRDPKGEPTGGQWRPKSEHQRRIEDDRAYGHDSPGEQIDGVAYGVVFHGLPEDEAKARISDLLSVLLRRDPTTEELDREYANAISRITKEHRRELTTKDDPRVQAATAEVEAARVKARKPGSGPEAQAAFLAAVDKLNKAQRAAIKRQKPKQESVEELELALAESVALIEASPAGPIHTGRLNRKTNVIEGTVLITAHSINGGKGGRRYSDNALKQIAERAEGLPAYLNHVAPEAAFKPRDVKDLIGVHRNVRYYPTEGKIVSDLHIVDHQAPLVFGLAEKLGGHIGNSLVSRGAVQMEGETEVVKEITAVRSADLVSDPATTKGLFESVGDSTPCNCEPDEPCARHADPLATIIAELRESLTTKEDEPMDVASIVTFLKDKPELTAQLAESLGLAVKPTKLQEQVTKLTTELQEAVTALDGYKAKEALAAKRERMAQAIETHDLGRQFGKVKEAVSDTFKSLLEQADEAKWGEMLDDRFKSLRSVPTTQSPSSHPKNQVLNENANANNSHYDRLSRALVG